MPYSEKLAGRVRETLAHLPDVEERKMFGGIAFMVNGKMCVTVGADRIMCRIDPGMHDEVIKSEGCRTVIMKGREYKGYVYINEDVLQAKASFNHWITLALNFNKQLSKITGKIKRGKSS